MRQIEGVDPDNARVVVKLAIGGKTVTVSQHCIKLVGRKEYEKHSKDLSECFFFIIVVILSSFLLNEQILPAAA